MIRLTKTGQLFLGVLVLLYLASLTSQSGLLLLPIGVLLGCVLVNAVAAFRAVRQIEVHPPPSIHLSEGDRMSQPWRITNLGPRMAGMVEAQSPAGTLFRLPALNPGDTANPVPELVYEKRGVYAHGQVRIVSSYPFGFAKASRRIEVPGEIVVVPAVYETESPHAAGYDVMLGGKLKGNRRTSSGSHFAGVRPHQPGDPLKHIHWKSSSKGQGLMVKTFDEELSGRVSLIMDCGQPGDRTTLDNCVRAAGSLVFAALDAGHHVEWIDLQHQDLMLIPPFADGHEILDALARIEAPASPPDQDRVAAALQKISTKSAVSFVLTRLDAPVRRQIDELLAHRRHVSVFLPAGMELPRDLAGVPLFHYRSHTINPAA